MINEKDISQIFTDILKVTPDPFRDSDIFWKKLNPRFRKTYREKLDERKINYLGEYIPRIEIVRQNLKRFKMGNTMIWRGLNVKDRRQNSDRRRK